MVKLCFHHEPFDRDVSSGTIHALYQWFELFHAFGVTECAIINLSGDTLPLIDSNMTVTEYASLDDFENSTSGNKVYLEHGGADYHSFDHTNTDWLVTGGTGGLPRADIGIDTGTVALYPREATAIVLASM